jgi:hypothetical protein
MKGSDKKLKAVLAGRKPKDNVLRQNAATRKKCMLSKRDRDSMLKSRREEGLSWKLQWQPLTRKSSDVSKKNTDALKRRECARRLKLQLNWLD